LGCLFKLVALGISSFSFLVVTLLALGVFLALSGEPEPCVDRSVDAARGAGADLRENWAAAAGSLLAGQPARVNVTEAQATAIAAVYLEERGVDVNDFRVYFCPGGMAEATGRVARLGVTSNVLLRGRLDFDGERHRIDIDSVRIGNVPSFLAKPVVELLVDENDVRTLPLTENITDIEYGDGIAVVTIEP
jgi:hypothetical protein